MNGNGLPNHKLSSTKLQISNNKQYQIPKSECPKQTFYIAKINFLFKKTKLFIRRNEMVKGIEIKKEGSIMPKIRAFEKPERIPSEFWEDKKWALEHYAELRKKYADTWVAVVNKKVVAFGEKLTEEKEKSIRKEIGRPFVTFFVEGEARIL